MQTNIMILPLDKCDGTKIDVPLTQERFSHADIWKTMPSLRFHEMDGWSILDALVPIIIFFRPYCIVEIGAGVSTKHLARIAEDNDVDFYSCDKSPRKDTVYCEEHKFIQKFSHDFMDEFDETPAVVLIDADHNYEIARMEFDFFYDKLVPGGVIFIHDTMPPSKDFLDEEGCGNVYRLRQELEKNPDIECFTWPYTAGYMGLTMVTKKYSDYREWEK